MLHSISYIIKPLFTPETISCLFFSCQSDMFLHENLLLPDQNLGFVYINYQVHTDEKKSAYGAL